MCEHPDETDEKQQLDQREQWEPHVCTEPMEPRSVETSSGYDAPKVWPKFHVHTSREQRNHDKEDTVLPKEQYVMRAQPTLQVHKAPPRGYGTERDRQVAPQRGTCRLLNFDRALQRAPTGVDWCLLSARHLLIL